MKSFYQLTALMLLSVWCVAQTPTNKLESTGNAGIGTTNPQTKLHLYGTDPGLFIEGDGNSYYPYIRIKSNVGNGYIDNYGLSNFLNGINMNLATTNGYSTIGATHGGIVSYSQNPSLIIHNVIGAAYQAGDVFRASRYSPEGYGSWNPTPMFNVTAAGNIGMGVTYPLERLHVAGGKFFLEAPDPGQHTSTPGAIFRMGAYPYSDWYAGLGVTRGEGVDVYDMDFYTMFGASSIKMKLTAFGALGIGTLTPSQKLAVNGNAGILNGNELRFYSPNNVNFSQIKSPNDGDIAFNTGGVTNAFYITNSGDVCIGTTTPKSKFSVNGTITTKKLVVTQQQWADYVFEDSYKLPTLTEVETFIKKHKHLPDVVSAKEVEKNGLDVGENQAVLLRKIEEMTLYMIEMKNELNQQREEIGQLKKQLKEKESNN